MKKYTLDELKQLIAAKLDLDEIFDVLGWDIAEFLDIVEDHIIYKHSEFEDTLA